MNIISSFVKRHGFVVFVVLAYALSWSITPFVSGVLLPWGPMIAALIVVALGDGRTGVKAWWRQVMQKGKWRWYGVALLPIIFNLASGGLNLLWGAQISRAIDWTAPIFVLPAMLLVSGMWEEPGWTGFALPRLLDRFGPSAQGTLLATLLMGVIRMGWHLPLMLAGSIYWSDILLILAVQIVIVWLFNASGRSVLAIMLLHLLNNIMAGEFVMQWFHGADWVSLAWFQTIPWSVLAIIVLVVAGRKLGRNPNSSISAAATAPAVIGTSVR